MGDFGAKWFSDLEEDNWTSLQEFCRLLRDWNSKINLVSRKDTDRLETKHLAHCLTITKFLRLMPKARILIAGTGGGHAWHRSCHMLSSARPHLNRLDWKESHGC